MVFVGQGQRPKSREENVADIVGATLSEVFSGLK